MQLRTHSDQIAIKPPPRGHASANPYLQRFGEAHAGRVQCKLYLFPYAGGSAAVFRQWSGYFEAGVELTGIQLPGHGSRMMETAETDYRVLVRDICDAILDDCGATRFAMFGHSMGALLAHYVALEMAQRGASQPECLFLSGCKAPHLPRERRDAARMSDADFVDELRRLDGTPAQILDNAELMALMLPTIKADFVLLDRWYEDLGPAPASPALSVPIIGMSGRRDIHCTDTDIDAWQSHTHGPLETMQYSGGHFFLQSQEARLVADIRERLEMFGRGA
ncbi:MAG: alpha/beta fold hydrolase [Massilia sp.]